MFSRLPCLWGLHSLTSSNPVKGKRVNNLGLTPWNMNAPWPTRTVTIQKNISHRHKLRRQSNPMWNSWIYWKKLMCSRRIGLSSHLHLLAINAKSLLNSMILNFNAKKCYKLSCDFSSSHSTKNIITKLCKNYNY